MNVPIAGWALLLSCCLSVAALGEAPARTHDITLDDYFTQSVILGCVMSPDGKQVAYSEARWEEGLDVRNTDLWTVNVNDSRTLRLTFEPGSENSPQWSPDSQYLYFSAKRKRAEERAPLDGTMQVWRIAASGGEIVPVTRVAEGIDSFRLSRDGDAIFFSKSGERLDDEWKELREEFPDLSYGDGVRQATDLWKLDLTTWRTERIYEGDRYIYEFDVSPDATRIAMITAPDDRKITFEGQSRIDVLNLATGEITTAPDDLWRKQAESPYGWLQQVRWSPDGKRLAFTVAYDGYPTKLIVADAHADSIEPRILPRPSDANVAFGLSWRTKDELFYIADCRARKRIYGVNVAAQPTVTREVTPGDTVVDVLDCSDDGAAVAYIRSGLDFQRDIFLKAEDSQEEKRLTDVNPQVATWKLPQIRIVTWKGAGGVDVEGVLELPPDYRPGKPLPMIVGIHGGPKSSDFYSFLYSPYGHTRFAVKGYAHFMPNYRGSTGYGDEFMTDLIGHENEIEVEDILLGVDAMVEQGIADPDRLGVMGWSNGGYLTNCLIARNRFKAASSGAGVFDMTIQWGEEDTPGHVVNYLQGLPWERAAEYQSASPLYGLGPHVKTATLIHVGENDPRCPPSHSRALHRALHDYLGLPAELVVYPDELHGLEQRAHRKAKMMWDEAWFDKYLASPN